MKTIYQVALTVETVSRDVNQPERFEVALEPTLGDGARVHLSNLPVEIARAFGKRYAAEGQVRITVEVLDKDEDGAS